MGQRSLLVVEFLGQPGRGALAGFLGLAQLLPGNLRKVSGCGWAAVRTTSGILDGVAGTGAKARVVITSTAGKREWGTVGVSENIIEASLQALVDLMEYALLRK